MTALIIVQARMGSTRFPGKSLAEIAGKPILWYLFRQLSFCRNETTSILATTAEAGDDPLAAYGESQGWNIFRGSADDVLGRYHAAAAAHGAGPGTVIVRITGDDIFPDPHLIDAALDLHQAFAGHIDCVFTAADRLPYGIGHESYVFSALERAHGTAEDPYDREHVSPYIRRNRDLFPRIEITPEPAFAGPPLSIDTPDDLERNAALLDVMAASTEPPFHVSDILIAAGGPARSAPPVKITPAVSSLPSQNLTLVRPDPSYSDDVLAYSSDKIFYRYIESPPMTERSEAIGFLEKMMADNLAGRRDYWLIVDNDSGMAVGTIGFIFPFDHRHKIAEMGYGLARTHWGSGRFQEACRRLLQYGFDDLKLERIQILTRIDNPRSYRGVEKLGFQREGILRSFYDTATGREDGIVLSLLRQDFVD